MLKLVGLLVILAVTSSEGSFKFPLVNFGLNLPKISQCSVTCYKNILKAKHFFTEFGKKYFQEVELPLVLSSCKCKIRGVDNFKLKMYCAKGSEGIDYIYKWTMPNLNTTCSCELPNNAVEVAEMLSRQDRPAATCGKPPYPVNTVKYKEVACCGSGEGKSNIELALTMENVDITGSQRINFDTETFYPLHLTGKVGSANLTYNDTPDFQDSFQCLRHHVKALTARVMSGFIGWFYPCAFGRNINFSDKTVMNLLMCEHQMN